jgi:hypothetical protein
MLNLDLLRIPNDEFEEEQEDELASAGFRVVEGDEEDDDAAEEASVEAEVGKAENPADDEAEADEGAEITDGLDELEEMEKDYANIPLGFEEEEE